MEIDERRVNQIVVLTLRTSGSERGRINGVQDAVRRHLDGGDRHFIIDLTECDWIDSSGLGELVKSMATVMRQGGSLKLCGIAPRMRNILEVTNLTSILEIYPDEAAALESRQG